MTVSKVLGFQLFNIGLCETLNSARLVHKGRIVTFGYVVDQIVNTTDTAQRNFDMNDWHDYLFYFFFFFQNWRMMNPADSDF